MEWERKANDFLEFGQNLIERTAEGTRSVTNGMGQGEQDALNNRRIEKILLRVGFEFIVKSLYIKKGWNIYILKSEPHNRFKRIEDIDELELDEEKTIDFFKLIMNLHIPAPTASDELKEKLDGIRKDGNTCIHSNDINPVRIDRIRPTLDELKSLFDR